MFERKDDCILNFAENQLWTEMSCQKAWLCPTILLYLHIYIYIYKPYTLSSNLYFTPASFFMDNK